MSTAIVDARGWQNAFDLRTGEKVEASGAVVEMVRDVLRRHPYPGDIDPGSNRWVSDTALDLIDRYGPRFVFLVYASQYFSGRHVAMPREERTSMISGVFLEVERFLDESGLAAFIVGTGGMTPLLGQIDVTRLDGLAVCTHWSTRYAGLYGPSPEDARFLREHPHIEKIVSREEIASLFGGTPGQAEGLPEFLMLAREGYAFKSVGDARRTPVMATSLNFEIPLCAPGRAVSAITGIRSALDEELREKSLALIFVEGVGEDEFPLPHRSCGNGIDWFYYEPGEAQYLTIVSGEHRFLDYPSGSGYKYLNDGEAARTEYPFSGHFKSIPERTIGCVFPGKSIAVGNKSMFMHMVAGADISVECFARNLYNQGTMAVIHREKG